MDAAAWRHQHEVDQDRPICSASASGGMNGELGLVAAPAPPAGAASAASAAARALIVDLLAEIALGNQFLTAFGIGRTLRSWSLLRYRARPARL